MIRFIDLGDQIYCDEESQSFAFYDTVTSTFETFNSSQDWETVAEFMEDYTQDNPIYVKRGEPSSRQLDLEVEEAHSQLQRRIGLIPSRFFIKTSDSPFQ